MAIETRKVAKATQASAEASRASVEQDKQQLVKLTEQTQAIISQAQLARAALEQSSLPLLLPVVAWKRQSATPVVESPTLFERGGQLLPVDGEVRGSMILRVGDINSSVWIIVEIRNIGTGLAMLTTPSLDFSRGGVGGTFFAEQWSGRLTTPGSQWFTPQEPAIPPGEITHFVARLEDSDGQVWNSLVGASGPGIRQIETTFRYQDLSRQHTYKMSVKFDWALDNEITTSALLRPVNPTYEGYDLHVDHASASQP